MNSHIKHRNMVIQVLLAIITLGIYTIYWFHVTLKETQTANGDKERRVWPWTILSIVPIANLFAWWRYSEEYAQFVSQKYPGIAIFILWIVFAPVVWFLVQTELNRVAGSNYIR